MRSPPALPCLFVSGRIYGSAVGACGRRAAQERDPGPDSELGTQRPACARPARHRPDTKSRHGAQLSFWLPVAFPGAHWWCCLGRDPPIESGGREQGRGGPFRLPAARDGLPPRTASYYSCKHARKQARMYDRRPLTAAVNPFARTQGAAQARMANRLVSQNSDRLASLFPLCVGAWPHPPHSAVCLRAELPELGCFSHGQMTTLCSRGSARQRITGTCRSSDGLIEALLLGPAAVEVVGCSTNDGTEENTGVLCRPFGYQVCRWFAYSGYPRPAVHSIFPFP